VLLIIGAAVFALQSRNKGQPKNQGNTNPPPAPASTPPPPAQTETKVFNVGASNFKFDLAEVKVKQGDKIKIVLTGQGWPHDWVVDEFDARTVIVQPGQTAEVEFVADKTGTFEYYCSVGTHRQMGMVGKLIVE
jgi:plastocyanin